MANVRVLLLQKGIATKKDVSAPGSGTYSLRKAGSSRGTPCRSHRGRREMGHTIANFRVFVNVWISVVFANKFWRPRPLPPRVPARFRIRFARARPARGRVGLSGRREMGHTIANFRVIIHVAYE